MYHFNFYLTEHNVFRPFRCFHLEGGKYYTVSASRLQFCKGSVIFNYFSWWIHVHPESDLNGLLVLFEVLITIFVKYGL